MMRWAPIIIVFMTAGTASAQTYIGALGGIATLSADAGSRRSAQGLALSSYAPSNGGALDLFAGIDLHDYFSVQANYIWNRNDLVLNSSTGSGTDYEEARSSSQHAGIFDFLVYFRQRDSWIRPYLALGVGISHLTSSRTRVIASSGIPAFPPTMFSSTGPVLRSHVGIDLRLKHKLDFRYSFSETIGHNEISQNLSPPGSRKLANFQNLLGFVVRF